METRISELLERLAEVAPEECWRYGPYETGRVRGETGHYMRGHYYSAHMGFDALARLGFTLQGLIAAHDWHYSYVSWHREALVFDAALVHLATGKGAYATALLEAYVSAREATHRPQT